MTAERFTAWCLCPSCGRLDCHGLRVPAPFDPTNPLHVALDQITMYGWVAGLGLNKLSPSQEADYEVIRTCRCGHEWGQM